MDNKRYLLKTASNLAEFGEETVLRRVEKVLRGIMKDNCGSKNPEERETSIKGKFTQMLLLYCSQPEILGGGNNMEKQMKEFVSGQSWIGLSQKDGVVFWNNKELEALKSQQLLFVLGWAARLAKERKRKKYIQGNSRRKDTIVYKSEEPKEDRENLDNMSMEEKLSALQKKFGRG